MQSQNQKTTMELLAPAGGFPAFEAALEAGADAVYVGAPGFNARALSRDFTFAEIGSMIQQAHGQGVKLYIAMNSLIKESEVPAALDGLSCFEQLRPDALIIQDLGLLYLARTWFPRIPLHASTLMSAHNSLAATELTNLGFERVVLARELTIEEMAVIHRKTEAEIEVFIHGAMCFSYSGLCMFSSLHGGKSSLRGQCVQPCRRQYSWKPSAKAGRGKGKGKTDAGYLFSMNDLCGVDVLPELREAGVTCLKIEGRMKSAQYVANTVAAYRMALDSIDESEAEQERVLREAHRLLDDAMARKRSSGFLLSAKPREAITPEQSGSSGRLLGHVKGAQQQRTRDGKNRLTIQLPLIAQVSEGDRLRLLDENSGKQISFTLRSLQVQGRRQKTGRPGQKVQMSLIADSQQQAGRNFQGSLFKVDVGSRITGERTGRQRSKKLATRKVVADRRKVEGILDHLCWKRGGVDLNLNRQAKIQPKASSKGQGKKRGKAVGRRGSRKELPWWVMLSSLADLKQRLPVRATRMVIPLNRDNMGQLVQLSAKIKKQQSRIIWHLSPVLHEADLDWYRQQVRKLILSGFSRFELGHCSQYGLFFPLPEVERMQRLELFGNYSLNLLNSAALRAVQQLGFQGAMFSLETEAENLAAAVNNQKSEARGQKQETRSKRKDSRGKKKGHRAKGRRGIQQKMQVGLYVYGRPPLFTARMDSDHFNYQQPFVSPMEEQFRLEHKDGLTLARASLPFSLLRWQQELSTTGVDYLMLDLSSGPIRQEIATATTLLARSGKRLPVLSGNFQGTLV